MSNKKESGQFTAKRKQRESVGRAANSSPGPDRGTQDLFCPVSGAIKLATRMDWTMRTLYCYR